MRRAKAPSRKNSGFERISKRTARAVGHPFAFSAALASVCVWAVTGPLFHFSDTWQLIINTSTTIMTFLIVFLIQHTQNCEMEAIQIKLDELIRATKGAHNALLALDDLSEKELDAVLSHYHALAKKARQDLRHGKPDTGAIDKPGPGGPWSEPRVS